MNFRLSLWNSSRKKSVSPSVWTLKGIKNRFLEFKPLKHSVDVSAGLKIRPADLRPVLTAAPKLYVCASWLSPVVQSLSS